ncbi:TPA: hypothetical protein HL349_23795 [Escherichia coli]|nr:hypothetical protein E0L08_22210 [Escherichia coli]HAH0180193.1 hypothetical protein [Escherichia coli]HAH0471498.1 hypothetical protein [Escherichia coli]HAJ0005348.1 hypothetical protein [Escherichia coli]
MLTIERHKYIQFQQTLFLTNFFSLLTFAKALSGLNCAGATFSFLSYPQSYVLACITYTHYLNSQDTDVTVLKVHWVKNRH